MIEKVTKEEAERLCTRSKRVDFNKVAEKMGVEPDYLRNNDLPPLEKKQMEEIIKETM